MLDLFNDKIVSVDYNRDQGFLTGMGIDTKDKTKNGDEAKTGKYTGGKGGDYEIVCNEPTQGAAGRAARPRWRTACPRTRTSTSSTRSTSRPAVGAAEALKDAGSQGAPIVSVDGGCDRASKLVKDGTIGATSQQYPVKMAELGVEAIAKIADGGEKPAVTPGLDFYDTGVALVTDKPVEGVREHHRRRGREALLGLTRTSASDRRGWPCASQAEPAVSRRPTVASGDRIIHYGKEAHVTTTVEHATHRPSAAEQFALRQQSPVQRIQHLLHSHPSISPLLVLIVVVHRLHHHQPALRRSPARSRIILQQVGGHRRPGVGQTLVILTAGIDLSVGAIAILSMLVMANLAANNGVPGLLALLIGIAVGTPGGCLNGAAGHPAQAAAVHRHPGHAEHLHRDRAALLRRPRASAGGRLPALLNWTGTTIQLGPFRITTGVIIVVLLALVDGVHPRARPPGAGTSTRWATTPRRRGWSASGSTGCCSASTPWPG